MRPLWQRWPTILAIVALILNVDLVIMPVFAEFGVHGLALFGVAAFFGTVEPCYWNWFTKWVVRSVVRTERVRRIAHDFQNEDQTSQFRTFWHTTRVFLESKFDWFIEHARVHADGGEQNERLRKQIIAFVKRTHPIMVYPLMIGYGFAPAGWTGAIFLRRTIPIPGGFILFLIANAIKTWAIGIGFLLLPFPYWQKLLVILGGVGLLLLVTRKVVRSATAAHQSVREGPP